METNKIQALVGIFVFYSTLSLIFIGVGQSTLVDSTMVIPDIEVPYSDILKSVNETKLTTFQLGEYGLSDRIDIKNVYLLNYSVDVSDFWTKRLSAWDYLNPFSWTNAGHTFTSIAKKWNDKYGTMDTISEGDSIYLYPRIYVNPKEGVHINAWVVAGVFDAESGANEYVSTYSKRIPFTGDAYETILRLGLGEMGNYDKYYVLDVIYTDVDLTGLSINEIIDYLIPSGKAEIAERYGGVIHGELQLSTPSTIAYHELQLNKQYGSGPWSSISKIMDMWNTGMKTMTDTSEYGLIAVIIKLFVYLPVALILGWILYTEIRSWVPFVSGDK